ncbi:EAL domain-containing protein [Pseudoduganella sp. LjRoot289]|uniref:putative bifunctional diguanylate cyclase/phosphodiesterase n=1 Tax=Pseudoduganella sp. LjRoot289 TaxID=3342314 RepID=UPI003ECF02F8
MDESEQAPPFEIGTSSLKEVMNVLACTFYVLDEAGYFALWNQRVELVTGLSAKQLRTHHFLDLIHPADRPAIAEAFCTALQTERHMQVETRLLAHGAPLPYLLSGARLQAGGQNYLLGTGLDLSSRAQRPPLADLRERAVHAASNGIVITRCQGRDNPIEYVNPAFERITGYSQQEVAGVDSRFMACGRQDAPERARLAAALAAQEAVTVVLRNKRKNGEQFWNQLTVTPVPGDDGRATHCVGIVEDITLLRQRTEQLEHQVTHDALTGLANRTLLRDRLDQALHAARRSGRHVAVVLMDLNKFKEINDTLGHDAGDQLLCAVAQRLASALRDGDTVARLGGDEFVLVLAEQPTLRYTLGMIERVRLAMAHPPQIEGRSLPLGASMGVAVFPQDGDSFTTLLRAADAAMYESKSGGPDSVHFYSHDMACASAARRSMEHALRAALTCDDLYLKYQPNVCAHSGHIVGMEALLRWRHPELGELLPAAFLAEAEANGLIVPLGQRVLAEVCGLIQRLDALGYSRLPVTMNASHREFSQRDYLPGIARGVAHYGVDPACLILEMREAELMRNPALAHGVARGLRELGVRLSVDEFGGGLSNLNCLRALPLEQLKMSPAPVREIDQQGHSGALAKTMLDIGRNLGINVVATGVETRRQHDFLVQHGCASMQGHFVSRPLTRPALEHWLHRRA